jgi:hypothetical protein
VFNIDAITPYWAERLVIIVHRPVMPPWPCWLTFTLEFIRFTLRRVCEVERNMLTLLASSKACSGVELTSSKFRQVAMLVSVELWCSKLFGSLGEGLVEQKGGE